MSGKNGGTVARNYAETLLSLARTAGGDPAEWGTMIRSVASAVSTDLTLKRFLESPRIPAEHKIGMIKRALGDKVPRLFTAFMVRLVQNRRQTLIPIIADEYDTLLDASSGIVHARVTVARETSDEEKNAIATRLSAAVGRTVIPHLQLDPSILGGVVVRIGDTVMDGSVRRRLGVLRRQISHN